MKIAAIILCLLTLAAPCHAQIHLCPGASGTPPANGWCYDSNSRRFMSNFGSVWAPMTHTFDIGTQAGSSGSSQWPALTGCTSNGVPTSCCTGPGAGATCSTANPTNLGLDPTNVTYGAKGDARGAGAWFGTAGDGTYNSADASCGTAARCFSSPSGNFTTADCHSGTGCTGPVDKIISIANIGPNVLPVAPTNGAFVQTSHSASVTVATVQSATLITLSATPTKTGTSTGLQWIMGTNDIAAFQSAMNAGDLHIPNKTYLIWPQNTGGNTATAGSSIFTVSYRDIYCDPGATLVNVNFDTSQTSIFDVGSTNNAQDVVIRGCTFEGTNVGTNASPGPQYDSTNGYQYQFLIWILGYNASNNGSNTLVTQNTFK